MKFYRIITTGCSTCETNDVKLVLKFVFLKFTLDRKIDVISGLAPVAERNVLLSTD